MKTKLFTLLFTLLVNASMMYAQNGTCGKNLTWVFDKNTQTLTIAGTGAMNNYGDTDRPWYSIKGSIKNVIIGEGVTTIGDYAFKDMNITSITLPQTLTSIGSFSIYFTKITAITFPSSLKSIATLGVAFSGNLTSVIFEGETPPTLGSGALASLKEGTKIKVPCGYADTYRNASGWNGLYSILYSDCEDVRYDGTCGENLSWVFDENTQTLTITGTGAMNNYGDTDRPWYSIKGSIKSVIIGEGVTTIGEYAFKDMNITSITLPQTLTSIGSFGIYFTKITAITFPSSLKSIATLGVAFSGNLTSVTFKGETPPTLESGAFASLKEGTKITVPCGCADVYRNASGWNGLYAAIEEDCSGIEIPEYTLSVISEDENRGAANGSGTYKNGTPVVISASAKSGYAFSEWSDGAKENPRIVTVSQDSTFAAIFAPIHYSINANVYPESAGSIECPSSAAYNDNISLSVSANDGYKFLKWSDGNINPQRDLLVEGEMNLTALFAVVIKDTIQTLYVESASPSQGSAHVQIIAVAESGYEFLCWSDFNTENPRTVEMDKKDVQEFTAYFQVKQGDVPSSVSSITSKEELRKYIEQGNVYIIKGEKVYSVQGQEVR